MSLKAFHFVFIVAAAGLALWFGVWCFEQFSDTDQVGYLVGGLSSILSAVGLAIYLIWFLKKSRNLSFLVALVTLGVASLPQTAFACSVCMGNPASPMVKSANAAVTFLLGVVMTVLVAFAGLFGFWARRIYKQDKEQNERHSQLA